MKNPNMNRALRAWGRLPDWVAVLAEKCDLNQSQAKVAAEIGVSSSAVNQVLARAYKGRLDRIEERVRGVYMRKVVQCPVLGEISTLECQDNQVKARSFKATNPLRRALFTACKTCPNREKPNGDI